MGRDELREAVGRLARRWRARPQSADLPAGRQEVSLVPGCAYGLRYSQALEDLQREVAEIKARLNGLLFLLGGAVALEVILRLMR